jgi:hypothetical protein
MLIKTFDILKYHKFPQTTDTWMIHEKQNPTSQFETGGMHSQNIATSNVKVSA